LCLLLYAQSALFAAPEVHHPTGHCCLLCHIGSLPFLTIATAALIVTIAVVERLIPIPDCEPAHDVLLRANSSRAPLA